VAENSGDADLIHDIARLRKNLERAIPELMRKDFDSSESEVER